MESLSNITLNKVLVVLVLVGALNWGTTVLGYNLVEIVNQQVVSLTGRDLSVNKIVYLAVAASAVMLAMNSNIWYV